MTYCTECLNKQQQINELEEEVVSLKAKLRYQERTAKEGFFGSSTPSSKIPIKPNSQKKYQHDQGGGKTGHKGHGRASICPEDADQVEEIRVGDTCPDCGTTLDHKGTKTRTVMDCQPVKMKRTLAVFNAPRDRSQSKWSNNYTLIL